MSKHFRAVYNSTALSQQLWTFVMSTHFCIGFGHRNALLDYTAFSISPDDLVFVCRIPLSLGPQHWQCGDTHTNESEGSDFDGITDVGKAKCKVVHPTNTCQPLFLFVQFITWRLQRHI